MKIKVDGKEISIKSVNDQDYISLTDIAKKRDSQEPFLTIRSWLKNSNTLPFLEMWEKLNNPDFKPDQMDRFKLIAYEGRVNLSPKQYIEQTGAIGITSKSGRYGGTYAHRYIAYHFAMWLEPAFQLLLVTEFDRLKTEEANRLDSEWTYSRFLSKVNYGIQNEMIKRNIIPRIGKGEKPFVFASEADLLNVAVFGMTAKEFREQFPKEKGNLRDVATIQELTVLANLESINAHLIESGASQQARFNQLAKIAAYQLEILSEDQRFIE